MTWTEFTHAFVARLQAEPALSLALFASLLITVYFLLMLTTRIGNRRPDLQAIILSTSMHLTLMLFISSIVIREHHTPRSPLPPETLIPISYVVDERPALEIANAPSPVPQGELRSTIKPEFARLKEPRPAEINPAQPTRIKQSLESYQVPPPDLQKPASSEQKANLSRAKTAPQSPAGNSLEFNEETAKAKVVQKQATPGERSGNSQRPRQEMATQRESTGPAAPLAITPAPLVEQELVPKSNSRRAPERTGLAGEAVPSRGALVAEDPGPGQSPDMKDSTPSTPRPGLNTATRERTRPSEGNGNSTLPSNQPSPQTVTRSREKTSPPSSGGTAPFGSPGVPQPYQLRELPQRTKRALARGASEQSEKAVEDALAWLARHQDSAGFWDADGFTAQCPADDRCLGVAGRAASQSLNQEPRLRAFDPDAMQKAGMYADTGLTGLVILSFLAAGYTHEEGKYADQVDRALHWLIRQQQDTGFLGGKALRYDKMYCHGMATLALGEACGMTRDPQNARQLRTPLLNAVQYIIDNQNEEDGGWRYLQGQKGDMSMFGWQLMALKSAEVAGLRIPKETKSSMSRFLEDSRQGDRGGLAAYLRGEKPKPSMTAEALFSRQMLGLNPDSPSEQEAVAFLLEHLPRETEPNLYYWYYGTLALYHHGGKPWEQWNDALRDTLVRTQRRAGHVSGSWDPTDPWGAYGGRLYSTTISTLCLEIYYRFLPLQKQTTDRERKTEAR